jgi:uncharacterized protein YfaA (DUF2138 family)
LHPPGRRAERIVSTDPQALAEQWPAVALDAQAEIRRSALEALADHRPSETDELPADEARAALQRDPQSLAEPGSREQDRFGRQPLKHRAVVDPQPLLQ